MGRTADWGRRPNLTQHILKMVGERVEEYTTVESGTNQMDLAITQVVPSSRSKNGVLKIRKPESLRCQRTQSGAGVLEFKRKKLRIITRYAGVVLRDAVVGACCPYPCPGKDSADSGQGRVRKHSK